MALPKRRMLGPSSIGPCSRPSRPSPAGRRGAPALTATARRPLQKRRAGMKKRIPAKPRNWTFACQIQTPVLITDSTGKGGLTADQNNSHIL